MDVEIGFLYKTFIITSSVSESEWMMLTVWKRKKDISSAFVAECSDIVATDGYT